MKKVVLTDKAPRPLGPYSQAIIVGDTVYVSGQVGVDASTGKRGETIEEQTALAIRNIESILQSVGSSLEKISKVTVILKNMEDFPSMNKIYSQFFKNDPPARTTLQASPPGGYLVEVEAIAML
ncbi:MAG: Rid family detoxifying hydrolase [Conexivisphaerales archaeon]